MIKPNIVTGWLVEVWDRVLASDPGLSRLQMASSATIGVASALAVEFGFAVIMHADKMGTIISMMLGAVVTMMGDEGTDRERPLAQGADSRFFSYRPWYRSLLWCFGKRTYRHFFK